MPAGPSSRSTKAASTPSGASKSTTGLSSHATISSPSHRQQQQKQQEESKEQLTSAYSQPATASSHSSRLTSASPPSASASYSTKTPLLVERAVIHDALIRRSLHADLASRYDAGQLGSAESIDVLSATSLLLSFQNLALIDHLSALTRLTKLQLDNNHITRIQGLDALVNLTWLDLSFNQISRVEGLDCLHQLTDLSLSHNHIDSIGDEQLAHLHGTLQCLTLANNRIASLDDIKRLRPFTALRLLVLKDNPIQQQQPEEYQLHVLAFLTQLVYFDYVAVEEAARLKARDNKLDAVLLLEGREAEERRGVEEAEQRARRAERNRTLGCCDAIERLWDTMLDKDAELRKLRQLPGVNERVGAYEAKMDTAVREYEEDMAGVGERKREEEERVREALQSINGRAEQQCAASIKQFQQDKKRLRAQYDQLLSQPPAQQAGGVSSFASPTASSSAGALPSLSSPLLPTLTALLNRYHTSLHAHISQLMAVQSGLTHNTSLLLAAFDSALHELSVAWSARTQLSFQALLAASKHYHDGLHDHVAVLLETAGNSGATTSAPAKDDAASKASDKPAHADRTDAEAAATGGGAAAGGRALLSDKEALQSAMSASRDCHDSLIMAKEDELREKEERSVKERIARLRADMIEQNRARVAEIYEMKKREERVIEEMMEKLSGDDEDDDGDATEQR